MAEKTGLPAVHLDQIHHLPGWVPRPHEEKIRLALEAQAGPEWIIEGGLSATYEDRFQRADTIIFLDLPLPLRAWRIFWRTVRYYGRTRPDMQRDCPERFNREFTVYVWRTRRSGRVKPLELMQRKAPDKLRVHLTRRSMVKAFLRSLDAEDETALERRHGAT